MSSIKIFFFGNLASKQVHYVIHQNFLFQKSSINMCCLCDPSIFSFFGNHLSKWVFYVIHQNFLFWKSGIKMCYLCHPSKFPFQETQHQHVSLMSSITISLLTIPIQNECPMPSIEISFFGNMASKCVTYVIHQISFFGNLASNHVAYVIHQNFLFWKPGIKPCCSCHPSPFSFLAIQFQNGCPRLSIKISFFGNFHPKCVAYVIYYNFLFWKSQPKMGRLCHPSKFPFLVSHMTYLSNQLIFLLSPFGLPSN